MTNVDKWVSEALFDLSFSEKVSYNHKKLKEFFIIFTVGMLEEIIEKIKATGGTIPCELTEKITQLNNELK